MFVSVDHFRLHKNVSFMVGIVPTCGPAKNLNIRFDLSHDFLFIYAVSVSKTQNHHRIIQIKITWGSGLANRQQMDFLFFEEKYKKPKIIPFINIVIILFDAGS